MASQMTSARVPSAPRPPMIPADGDIETAPDRGEAPILADAERHNERDDGRDEISRIRPREPNERYKLDPHRMKKGMDYFFAAATISGQPNPRFPEYFAAGWRPARAEDYPEISKYGMVTDPRLIELGYMKKVEPGDPCVDRGLMLMTRPKALSDQSRAEEQRQATGQFSDHMNRLKHSSRRAIGDRTQLSRTRGAPTPDMIPDEAELEE